MTLLHPLGIFVNVWKHFSEQQRLRGQRGGQRAWRGVRIRTKSKLVCEAQCVFLPSREVAKAGIRVGKGLAEESILTRATWRAGLTTPMERKRCTTYCQCGINSLWPLSGVKKREGPRPRFTVWGTGRY